MRFVYIVRCNDNSLYTGITKDLIKRIDEHNNSPLGAKYTRNKRPITLVWSKQEENRSSATKLEQKIKKLTKIQKEKLIIL
jgi:putative endonuclease